MNTKIEQIRAKIWKIDVMLMEMEINPDMWWNMQHECFQNREPSDLNIDYVHQYVEDMLIRYAFKSAGKDIDAMETRGDSNTQK